MKKSILGILLGIVCLFTGCTSNTRDGVAYLEEEKYQEAIECFEKDIKEEKKLDEAYRGMGIAYFELENYEASVESFEKALDNDAKESVAIYSFLGAGYLELGSYEAALENYAKALQMEACSDEMKQEILFNEIAIYQEMGDWETVKEKVDAYVKAYPEDERMDKTVEFLETR